MYTYVSINTCVYAAQLTHLRASMRVRVYLDDINSAVITSMLDFGLLLTMLMCVSGFLAAESVITAMDFTVYSDSCTLITDHFGHCATRHDAVDLLRSSSFRDNLLQVGSYAKSRYWLLKRS